MITRMAATARTIPKTDVSVPKTDASPVGSGFGAIYPLLAVRYYRYQSVCRTFRGANRGRCVSYFTLRIIIILMETIKDIYPPPRIPGGGGPARWVQKARGLTLACQAKHPARRGQLARASVLSHKCGPAERDTMRRLLQSSVIVCGLLLTPTSRLNAATLWSIYWTSAWMPCGDDVIE
jgi:hypothetical protein